MGGPVLGEATKGTHWQLARLDPSALKAPIEQAGRAGVRFVVRCSLAQALPLSGSQKGADVDYNVSMP
jgi:hypothetical protein